MRHCYGMSVGGFLPSAKPHGQQMAFGVREEGGRHIQENHLQQVVVGVSDLDLEMTLTLK